MTTTITDIVVVGGGIAGLSAAAALATGARVVVLEAEANLGVHSSGRSATFYHFGIGNAPVRALTAASRSFFDSPPEAVADAPLGEPWPALFIATESMIGTLDALEAEMRRFSPAIERVDVQTMLEFVPVLRTGPQHVVAGVLERAGRRLDADRLLQGCARAVRARGGRVRTGVKVEGLRRERDVWRVTTNDGVFEAPFVVNAAGAWADTVAELAGVRPLGLTPLRRTVIIVEPPSEVDSRRWPFTKTAVDEFYMLPDGGRLLVSPVDENPSEPCDPQPEEYDLALAAWRVEEYTTLAVKRIPHRWAGLRTFTRDRIPVAGFAPDEPGFFWLAGQGGYGLQTAPAMASAVASLILGSPWPDELARRGVEPAVLAPQRLAWSV